MNALNIPQHIIQSIGWTLIHSLWQGLLIFILLKIASGLLPSTRSDARYGLGVGALLVLIISSVTTFFALDQTASGYATFNFDSFVSGPIAAQAALAVEQPFSVFTTALHWIDANIIWLLRFWMLGFVIGLIRIAAGLWYIGRLRRNAHPVQEEWMNMVNSLSESLNIKRVVAIAEAGITSPMVVGFMKPMILFPFGLLTGLTGEQVETIIVHELSHVRRQDYVINLFQAIVETIFFFNPFVMLISSLIREERENCCDDMVIAKGISPMTYVRTLAQLEASRSSSALALGISGNKNQLLNRIKRIMENSAKNDWGKGRLVPVALIFLGLICASWLSIGSEAEAKVSNNNIKEVNALAADTSKEDGLKVIKSNKHRQHEAIAPIPEIEFIPEVENVPPYIDDMDVFVEGPDGMMMPMIEGLEGLAALEALEALRAFEPAGPMNLNFNLDQFNSFDSIPGFKYRSMTTEEMEEFEKEFTKKFKAEFKDFYEKNQDKLGKMMDEVKKEHRDAADVVDLEQLRRYSADDNAWNLLNDQLWEMHSAPKAPNPDVYVAPRIAVTPRVAPFDYSGDQVAHMADQLAQVESMKALQSEDMARIRSGQFQVMGDKMREQSDFLADMARQADDYKKELAEMLRDDGYINKNENLDNLNINDSNNEMVINGKKIKEKDAMKYRALRDKYFGQKFKRRDVGRSE
ncbi:MAG TPA: M56 family metallopeptidase [Cyclobacteriaceae bacterium]|nr:M56 family metallopeptidase [Cyclobacteriaceae bacterium]